MHRTILDEARDFSDSQASRLQKARQTVAFRLATGVDLDVVAAADEPARAGMVARLVRLVERERLRGARRHWAYDLNRHIALAQALAALRAGLGERPAGSIPACRRKRSIKA